MRHRGRPHPGRCRGSTCGAAIWWAKDPNGKPVLVDYEPVDPGTLEYHEGGTIRKLVLYTLTERRGRLVARRVTETPAPIRRRLYQSHWQTCACPEEFKKPRR